MKILAVFVKRYMKYRYIVIGFLLALAVFILRAYTNGSIVPLVIKDLADAVGRGNIIGDGGGTYVLMRLAVMSLMFIGKVHKC